MADALLVPTVQVALETAIDLVSEQTTSFLGFKNDFARLHRTLAFILAVLCDAEKRQVTEEAVKLWLEELERLAFDAGNLLDDINYEMNRRRIEIQNQTKKKVCFFFFSRFNSIAFRYKMAKQIWEINMELQSMLERANRFGLVLRDYIEPTFSRQNREIHPETIDTSFVGRDDDVSAIVTQLTATDNNENISVLPIVGLGGIGKTAVARKVFNDPNIKKHFDKRMWVCVSEDFDVNRLFGLMLESLKGPMPEVEIREVWVKRLKELLDGRNYLLVLDDVWAKDLEKWIDFLVCLKGIISQATGSWILVTARDQRVASIMGISSPPWYLKELSDDQCWLVLKENAFGTGEVPDGLQHVGFKIAQRCQGLPLAASILGGMLCNKGAEEWRTLESGIQSLGGDENIEVVEILKLSFDHLPYPSLKKCLAYCSIFPRGFQMERNQLIQLWAAEGFLHPRHDMYMEEVGNEYFSILLDSNLFQGGEKDDYGNVLNCKMHDLVYDMVQFISKSKTRSLKDSTEAGFLGNTLWYLAVESNGGEEIQFPLNKSFRYITTLFLLKNKSINFDGWISSLTSLRVLNLASSDVEEFPESINKLSHLRYLDSSDTPIKTLPVSLCQLINLQTLRVRDCKSLTNFPNNFKNLVSLRHFDYFSRDKSSDIMPLEIGQLYALQTLPFFNIGEEAGRQIGQLGSLDNLSGSFEIRNLELVRSKKEAKSANLIEKSNINELKLLWNEFDRENDIEYNQVLEGLQPHQNLKVLIIERFFGDQLSTWIGKLEKLVKFELRNCRNCKELPTLGHMPFLKYLHLEGLDNITTIGPSFYGKSTVHSGSSSQLFPALKHLILENMLNLREWVEALGHDEAVVVFPVLNKMMIKDCPKIVTFPSHFPRLKNLHIEHINNGSSIVTCISNSFRTLTSLSIDNMNGFTELPYTHIVGSTQNLVGLGSLEELHVCRCHSLKSISIPRVHPYFNALRKLRIFMCSELTHLSIPQIYESEWDSSSSSSSTCPSPLEELEIWGCPNLVSFSIDLTRRPSLSFLNIPYCKKLTDLPKGKLCSLTNLRRLEIGPFSETTELHSFLDLFDALLPPPHPYLPFLWKLSLVGWPHWESLPDQLRYLSALTYLELDGFGVKSLPDWFGKLSSLERLYLNNCKKLENLSSDQTMRSLTILKELRIEMCPLLTERCNSESTSSSSSSSTIPISEWSKISDVPKMIINGQRIRG